MKKTTLLLAIAAVGLLVSCKDNSQQIARIAAQLDSLKQVTQRLEADNDLMSEALGDLTATLEIMQEKTQKPAPAPTAAAAPKQQTAPAASSAPKQEQKAQPKASASTASSSSSASASGYYMKIGTKKELKSAGLLDKGVIKKGIVNPEGLNMSVFKKVDIRSTKEIRINVYKPKLLTSHPKKSYEMELDEDAEDDITYLRIKDPEAFWSESHFLIIQM